MQKIFCVFFLRPPTKITNFNTLPMPPSPFENFSLNTLNGEEKLSVKKTGRPGRSETGRLAGQPAMILKGTGRVEKILIGSISDVCNVSLAYISV